MTPRRKQYFVTVDGAQWGLLAWRGYRLLLVRVDGKQKLFHRSARLRTVREAIAKMLAVPANAVALTEVET